ncbi:alpha/beta fold hydrolase [Nonomuraea sp. NPDC050153]|uniref:alpha/beta fold hydrolase n=1 Tax=Nonomuraea sp. NPDC050153 TaxID=3364359 RepID=UPI0037977610
MERRLYVLAASAFIVAAVLGSAWITGQFTTPEVDRTDGYVSELAARDQPWTRLFRTSDALAGLACAAGVALVPRVAREWQAWLALAVFGLFTFAAGLFPLDCATLSDPYCGRQVVSTGHHVHQLAGALATAALLASMVLLSLRWRSWVSWLFTWLGLAATLLTAAALADRHGVGLAHRAQLTLFAVWLVYVAVHLLITDEPPVPPVMAGAADPDGGHAVPHVVEQGAGPVVLITAGLGGAWFHWGAVAGRLAGSHRVIRFDRCGLGLSPHAPVPPTLYTEVARLAALAPSHPEQVTVVAHGAACWHAEAFARLHPLRVAKLVLVDPAPVVERGPSALAASIGRWLPTLGGTWGATAVARLVGPAAHRLIVGVPDPYGVYRMGKVPAAVAGEWLARRDMVADLLVVRAESPFPDVPVTVISAGERNADHERLAGALSAKLVRLPGAGHQVQIEDPGAVADAVLDAPRTGPAG